MNITFWSIEANFHHLLFHGQQGQPLCLYIQSHRHFSWNEWPHFNTMLSIVIISLKHTPHYFYFSFVATTTL